MADTKLQLLLEARNNASAKLKEVQQDLGKLDNVAGTAAKGVSGLMGAFALGGISAFVGVAGAAVTEMARLAAQSQQVESAFRGMEWAAGESADGMLAAMRRASGGTVSDTELMLNANKALMLGVANSSDEIVALMNVAASRGRAMGLSMQQAFGDIVTGLGRGSALILDNLGIIVDAEQANADYAASIGKTSAALTEAERKQALVNSVMKEAASIEPPNWDTAASDFERMETSIANAKSALGELFSPAVAAVAQSIANAVEGAMDMADPNRGLTEAQITLQSLNRSLQYYNMLVNQNKGTNPYRVSNDAIQEARASLAQLVVDYNVAAMKMGQPIIDYTKLVAGQADFFIAMQQYNPAAVAAQELAVAQEEANAQLQAAAVSAANFNSILATIIPHIEGLSSDQINNLAGNAKLLFDSLVAGGMSAADALKEVERQVNAVVPALRNMGDAAIGAASGVSTLGQVAPGASRGVSTLGIEAAKAAANVGLLMNALSGLQSIQRTNKAAGIIAGITDAAQAKRGWEEVRTELKRYNDEGARGAKMSAELQQVGYLSYPTAKGIGGVSAAVRELNQEFEALKSKAQSVLTGALNLEGISFPEGPRQDALNENARRLAAIANEGMGNQSWMDEFKAEVPNIAEMLAQSGDPKALAAQLLRDFQDGLVPELIDAGAAKERVKRMILGDQNMAAMAQQIAQELSQEMGISLAEAQKATGSALGLSGGEAGAPLMDGNKEGNRFIDGVSQAMAARQQEFYTSGANAGTQWGTGFLAEAEAGVPMALIFMLAGLVKKANDEQNAANRNRTEAK